VRLSDAATQEPLLLMTDWLTRLARSFRCAFRGLAWLFVTERNAKIHLLATVIVIGLGAWLHITMMEWCVLMLTCGMVIAVEAMNSAIEKLADRITTEEDERIRVVKDVGAAGVLVASITAALVGLLVFVPRLLAAF
jgi:diacylglycerol kinase